MLAHFAVAAAFAAAAVAAPMNMTTLQNLNIVGNSMSMPNTTQNNTAVWYLQNGKMGACGLYSNDTELVVGLPPAFYNNTGEVSSYCGSYIVVTNPLNNMSITARVADASATNETLSMSVTAWRQVEADQTNMHNVSWIFANDTQTASAVELLSHPVPMPAAYTPPGAVAATSTPVPAPTSTPAPTTSSPAYVAPSFTYTPSSSSAAPAATAQLSASSGSSGTYSGSATYYTQNGNPGACGNYNSDSAMIVAIDSAMYAGGSNCGKMVRITRTSTGQSISAMVADECPTCNSGESLDLSVAAFNSLASESTGLFDMTWSFE